MSEILDLRQRVEAAEQQFGVSAAAQAKYSERLITLVNTVESAAKDAREDQEQTKMSLLAAQAENEQLRGMLHTLLLAIEKDGDSIGPVLRDLESAVSAISAAESGVPGESGEVPCEPAPVAPAEAQSAEAQPADAQPGMSELPPAESADEQDLSAVVDDLLDASEPDSTLAVAAEPATDAAELDALGDDLDEAEFDIEEDTGADEYMTDAGFEEADPAEAAEPETAEPADEAPAIDTPDLDDDMIVEADSEEIGDDDLSELLADGLDEDVVEEMSVEDVMAEDGPSDSETIDSQALDDALSEIVDDAEDAAGQPGELGGEDIEALLVDEAADEDVDLDFEAVIEEETAPDLVASIEEDEVDLLASEVFEVEDLADDQGDAVSMQAMAEQIRQKNEAVANAEDNANQGA